MLGGLLKLDDVKEEFVKGLSNSVVLDISNIVASLTSAVISSKSMRILYGEIDRAFLAKIRSYLVRDKGIIVTTGVPTAAINYDHLWINPEFWMRLNVYDKLFGLSHEIDHLNTGLDWERNWGWDPFLTNLVLDLYINHQFLKKPYGTGRSNVSLELARSTINYVTVKTMIANICGLEKSKKLVSELKLILTKTPYTPPILYDFFARLARECGKDSVRKYAEEHFVLYNDITYPNNVVKE